MIDKNNTKEEDLSITEDLNINNNEIYDVKNNLGLLDYKNFNIKHIMNSLEKEINYNNTLQKTIPKNNYIQNKQILKTSLKGKISSNFISQDYLKIINPLCGLNNLGNTYYKNEALYCFIHNKYFIQKLVYEKLNETNIITNLIIINNLY